MAAKTQVTIDDYLSESYEFEPEWVNGEIVGRTMPDLGHSRAHTCLAHFFEGLKSAGKPLRATTECRLRLATSVRVPDVSVFEKSAFDQLSGDSPPTAAPLVAIEIISPSDRHLELLDKLHEYRNHGVRHVWVVDPQHRRLSVFDGRSLSEVEAFTIPEYEVVLTGDRIFD